MESLKYIILLVVVLKLIKNLLDGYNEPKVKPENAKPIDIYHNRIIPIDQMVNYSNEKAISGSLKSHYEHLLSLKNELQINPDVIYKHYYDVMVELERESEYDLQLKKTEANDVIAAKEYLHDLCRYYGNRN